MIGLLGNLDGYKTRNVFMAQTSSLLEEFFGSSVIEAVKLFLGTDEPSNNVTKIILKSQFDLIRQVTLYCRNNKLVIAGNGNVDM